MQLSDQGFDVLDQEEGDVLRTYRDVAGVLTISRGLTAASGVVKPVPGMVITQEESDRLTRLALARNYEPAVEMAMKPGNPKQHEFDAAVLFHWNTGAITRATWVRLWLKRAWATVEPAFKSWNKADGKVNAVLVRRREREFMILRYAQYPAVSRKPSPPMGDARIVAPVTVAEFPKLRAALQALGYEVGSSADAISAASLRQFQKDHGLTADGILGRATAATIQRRVDAAAKAKITAVAGGTGIAGGTAGLMTEPVSNMVPWLGPVLIAACVGMAAWRAWQYRDAIAAKVQHRMPRLAAYLRSI
ncbi:glycoside hydrolase family protein [Tabrizicola fusiformis]|uniref:glycoside hydrolase family protein n=1 Tax=Tabrizicola sp. SY72 TaxID=2741673 RepID=UPI001573001C|nr:peptidoglycan-binding protein [Tabrizicola sp. SY72]NTT88251.1 peptidoglycan-binding protein [Tabrizicola sp. SY72]